MQSKKHSHYEILTNQVVGIVIGWLIVAYILIPLSRTYTPEEVATLSSFIFFVASYVRSYSIRRLFNWLAIRNKG